MEKLPDCAASPRWVAKEYGFELISEDGENFEYKHPVSGIGLLISVRKFESVQGFIFDWSIHEPETEKVIVAEYNQSDGTSFLRSLISVLAAADASASSDFTTDSDSSYLTDSPEDSGPTGTCKSCKQERSLDSNGFCYFC